jgi:YVTN family beta-propeller protein
LRRKGKAMKALATNFIYLLFVMFFVFSGCKTEKILSEKFDPAVFNGPIGISIIPGADLALVTNSNFRLEYISGSLTAIDLTQDKIIPESTVALPDFSGDVAVDISLNKIFIPNRVHNSLIVYDYKIPGDGGLPISFTAPSLPNSISGLPNEMLMDENPFGIIIANPPAADPKIFVSSIKEGSVNVINALDLLVVDENPEDDEKIGIPLQSIVSIDERNVNDGVGANRFALSNDSRLAFLTSSRSNYIFVIDLADNKVEGVIDLAKYASKIAGARGILVAPDDRLYVAHRGLGGVIVLDVSDVKDNGLNNEFIEDKFISFIPTGAGPEGIAFDQTGSKLYVCNEEESTVSVIDLASLSVSSTIYLERSPTEIAVNPSSAKAYITNFLSNSVSVIDTNTDLLTGVIK